MLTAPASILWQPWDLLSGRMRWKARYPQQVSKSDYYQENDLVFLEALSLYMRIHQKTPKEDMTFGGGSGQSHLSVMPTPGEKWG